MLHLCLVGKERIQGTSLPLADGRTDGRAVRLSLCGVALGGLVGNTSTKLIRCLRPSKVDTLLVGLVSSMIGGEQRESEDRLL